MRGVCEVGLKTKQPAALVAVGANYRKWNEAGLIYLSCSSGHQLGACLERHYGKSDTSPISWRHSVILRSGATLYPLSLVLWPRGLGLSPGSLSPRIKETKGTRGVVEGLGVTDASATFASMPGKAHSQTSEVWRMALQWQSLDFCGHFDKRSRPLETSEV